MNIFIDPFTVYELESINNLIAVINAYFVAHGPGRMPTAGAKFYSKEELFAR